MATDAAVITATNLANWIPDIWSQDVISDVEKLLVTGMLVDRRYEAAAAGGGDVIVVPNLFNLTANVVNTSADMVLYDSIQNVTNISLNKKYDVGVVVDDINRLQTNPKYYDAVRGKLSYALARQIDINTNVLFKSFSQAVGVVNVAITEDEIIDAWTKLNLIDAPSEGRAWIFDPETIQDLAKLDYFVRMDYVPDSMVRNGFQGRQILGSPTYMTSNLDTYAGGPHAAAYIQRQAIALVVQMPIKFEAFRLPLQHGDGLSMLTVFGVQEMRDSFGVCINTRS